MTNELRRSIGLPFLAFYSFIGFEDMVNLAEEVRSVRRNLPCTRPVALHCAQPWSWAL